jgi:hypothetical protein
MLWAGHVAREILDILQASTARYRESFTFYTTRIRKLGTGARCNIHISYCNKELET